MCAVLGNSFSEFYLGIGYLKIKYKMVLVSKCIYFFTIVRVHCACLCLLSETKHVFNAFLGVKREHVDAELKQFVNILLFNYPLPRYQFGYWMDIF